MAHPQRAFRFGVTATPTLSEFLPGSNAELLARLVALAKAHHGAAESAAHQGGGFLGLWLYAEDSVGKTHLLRAATTPDNYLPLHPARAIAQLAAVAGSEPLALDDVDSCIGNRHSEEALLGVYQLLFAQRVPLLVSSRVSPRALEPLLPDLASRFRAFETFALAAPGEGDQRVILQRQARRRGLNLLPEVLDFWLLRTARSLRARLEDLELVLDYALGAQRPITVPLLKEALEL